MIHNFLIEVESNKIFKKVWLGKVGAWQIHRFAANSQIIDSLLTLIFIYVLNQINKIRDIPCCFLHSLFHPRNCLVVSLDMPKFLHTARKLGKLWFEKTKWRQFERTFFVHRFHYEYQFSEFSLLIVTCRYFFLGVKQPLKACSAYFNLTKNIKLTTYQVIHTFQISTQNSLPPFL